MYRRTARRRPITPIIWPIVRSNINLLWRPERTCTMDVHEAVKWSPFIPNRRGIHARALSNSCLLTLLS
jgi:hypothetical protein